MSETYPITEFDMITLNQSMHMFKALIPFLDFSLQKNLSLYIRTQELIQTMHFYNHPCNILNFSICNSATDYRPIHSINDIFENERLIDEVLKYCPKEYSSAINTFRQFSKMSDLFNLMNIKDFDFNKTPETSKKDTPPENENSPFNSPLIKSIFKPEQQKMYDEYIKQLDKLDFLNKTK